MLGLGGSAGGAGASTADYGRLPGAEHVAISPDGTRLAFVRTEGDTRLLAIVQLEPVKPLRVLRLHEVKLRGVEWADDGHLLISESVTALPMGLIGDRDEWSLLTSLDLKTGKEREIPSGAGEHDKQIMNTVNGDLQVRRIEGRTVVFVSGLYVSGDRLLPGLFRVDLQTGRQRLVREGAYGNTHWVVDERGEVVAESEYVDREQQWVLRIPRDGRFRPLLSRPAAIDLPHLLGLGPDSGTLLLSELGPEGRIWHAISVQDGQTQAPRKPTGEPSGERWGQLIEDPPPAPPRSQLPGR